MLAIRRAPQSTTACRRFATAASLRRIDILPSDDLDAFRQRAFRPELPAMLPQLSAGGMPAIKKWFTRHDTRHLNTSYLARFGSVPVPLEFTDGETFNRATYTLSFFLECDNAQSSTYDSRPYRYFSQHVPGARAVHRSEGVHTFFTPKPVAAGPRVSIYLAQAPIIDLPRAMQADVPVPALVKYAGKGDVYDSSIWLGRAPTYTPLHKDPNPNLFVQLAGTKVIRIFKPAVGKAIFAKVQENIGGNASESMRGEEMMQGRERTLLEHEVWAEGSEYKELAFEAELASGDALFIPKGWWHSVRGIGKGINGSVNWWFR